MNDFLNFILFFSLLMIPSHKGSLAEEYCVIGLASPVNVTVDHGDVYYSNHCVANMVNGLSHLGLPSKIAESLIATTNKGQFIPVIKERAFQNVSLVHIEGLYLYFGTLMEEMMHIAKKAGAKVSLDVGNPVLVAKYRERILGLLPIYADILFVSEEEAFGLTHLPAKEAAQFLKNYCQTVVVKVGNQGCWVASDKSFFHAPAILTTVIDASGAGDLFISAFLYGYLQNFSLKACARFGNLAGGAALEQKGSDLPPSKWKEIRQAIHKRH